jgi:hypothetical protein
MVAFKVFSYQYGCSRPRFDSDVVAFSLRAIASHFPVSFTLCRTIYDSSSCSQPAGSTGISRRSLTISSKRSGCTKSSAKVTGSDLRTSRGVGWASRQELSDRKPSNNSLQLSRRIHFCAVRSLVAGKYDGTAKRRRNCIDARGITDEELPVGGRRITLNEPSGPNGRTR